MSSITSESEEQQKELINNPHDSIFKYFMQDVNVTRDFLKQYLPDNIKQVCDLSTLHMDKFFRKKFERGSEATAALKG